MIEPQSFDAVVEEKGTRACIVVPFVPDEVWGAKDRHYVAGTVDGHVVRGLIASDGAEHFLPLGAAWRRGTGIGVGRAVHVELAPEGPQGERLPPDVSAALDANPDARRFFEGLATFYRKNFMRWVEGAKRPATRAARIQEMVRLLGDGIRER